jgi:hypothetical protein
MIICLHKYVSEKNWNIGIRNIDMCNKAYNCVLLQNSHVYESIDAFLQLKGYPSPSVNNG